MFAIYILVPRTGKIIFRLLWAIPHIFMDEQPFLFLNFLTYILVLGAR